MIIVSDKTRATTTVSAEEEVCRPAAGCSRDDLQSRMNCLSSGKSKKDAAKEAGTFGKVTVIRNKRERGGAREAAEKPASDKEQEKNVKRFKGDGLSVKMDSNNRVLVVKGDGCNVTLSRNSGRIRVVGDGCRLKVDHNVGYIEYEGDGGRVLLGPRSIKERVKYVGDGGQISFNHGARASPRNQEGAAPRKPEEYQESKRSEDVNGSVKKIVTTTTTTTTVTTMQNGKKSVEKWFVDPASVISSFAGLNLKL